jgi:hypothetical protein
MIEAAAPAGTITQPLSRLPPASEVTLTMLCAVTSLDVVDGSIVNVALPTIRTHLGFSVQNPATSRADVQAAQPHRLIGE